MKTYLVLMLILFLSPGVIMADTQETSPAPSLDDFDALWNYGAPAETELKFRRLLPEAERRGDLGLHAQLLTQIARCQGLQRQFEAAHATLDSAETLIGPEMTLASARLKLERGRTLNSSGKREESRPLFSAALEIAQAGGHEFHAVDAAHMLGIVEEADRALEWNLEAIGMAEAAEEERARNWLGALYNNTGWTLHDRGDYQQALILFEKALAYRETKEQAPETRIAKWCVARCLRSLERTDEALARQQALLAEIEAAGADQDGYVFEELGECLHALGRKEEARPWFAKAHALLSKDPWLEENEAERLARLEKLAGAN